MTKKFSVTYEVTKDVEASDRGEAIAKVRDEVSPQSVAVTRVVETNPTGQYL